MFRNSRLNNYSSGSLNKESMRRSNVIAGSLHKEGMGRSNIIGGTGGAFYPRAPLYPIGPTITQPNFKVMTRGHSPSPYLQNVNIKPPSYEQRYLRT